MKKRIGITLAGLFFAVLAVIGTTAEVKADTGPKPSTVIDFENMNGEKYYVTLLSESKSTGPYSAYEPENGGEQFIYGDTGEIWKTFYDYKDSDGFYFLQYYEEMTGDGEFRWGYFPPGRFKILLYFPERGTYVVSREIYERYAFDSYYRVDGSAIDFGTQTVSLVEISNMGQKSYKYGLEMVSLAARIIITIAIELGIALIFSGFRKKLWIRTILFTNLATQVLLNAGLNAAAYFGGPREGLFAYIALEIGVIIVECAVYFAANKREFLKNGAERAKAVGRGNGLIFAYAVAANLASFFAGLGLAKIIPGIF